MARRPADRAAGRPHSPVRTGRRQIAPRRQSLVSLFYYTRSFPQRGPAFWQEETFGANRDRRLYGARVEHFPHFAGKLRRTEWLRQIPDPRLKNAPAGNRIPTISGHIQNLTRRTHGFETGRQFRSRHTRHDNIGDKHIDWTAMSTRELQSTEAVSTTQHLIATTRQHVLRDRSYLLLILD